MWLAEWFRKKPLLGQLAVESNLKRDEKISGNLVICDQRIFTEFYVGNLSVDAKWDKTTVKCFL